MLAKQKNGGHGERDLADIIIDITIPKFGMAQK